MECADIIDTASDVGERHVVLHRVALASEGLASAFPSEVNTNPGERFRYFLKDGLLVRPRTGDVEVAVPLAWRRWVGVGWGSPARVSHSVSVTACESEEPWVVYSGGFFVDEPVCAPIIVRVGRRRSVIQVGLGTRCGS